MRLAITFFTLAALAATGFAQKPDREMALLASWMTGSFDTFEQVDADEEADAKYRHVRALLHVVPVSIPELKGGHALYVENQLAEQRTKPYRQRVYFLTRVDGRINLSIFRISGESDFANGHKNKAALDGLTFAKLTREEGCDLTFSRTGKTIFKGSNFGGRKCRSALRGATHTSSESEVSDGRWVNLDQGFDDEGNHKWGPPPGTVGHIFIRRR